MRAPIVIISEDVEQVDEAVMRLARVGLESVKGYLGDGMLAWDKAGFEVARIEQMPVDELKNQLDESADLQLIDVRRPGEYGAGHAPTAVNVQLARLEKCVDQLDLNRPTAVICQSGYRSSAAASILARHGFKRLYNVVGGTTAWVNAGYAVESAGAVMDCSR
jgi:hydroxyacylglutathione hydrolase